MDAKKLSATFPFEPYADDVICHCESERQAKWLWGVDSEADAECKLELNSRKDPELFIARIIAKKGIPERDL